MTIDPADEPTRSAIALDPLRRERLSVSARRHVLREHDRRRRFEAVLDAIGIPLTAPPLVSVLLSTRRPDRVPDALANIGLQRYPNVEVVAVLHGDGFRRADVERLGASLSVPVSIIEAPATWRLGDCLNAALESATGELVTKMDDDDAYGPEHIEDLVTAYRFSGADIVGRAPDFVYLAELDETLMITTGLAERYGHHVAGPTMLMSRALARTLRFERRPSAVDQSLYDRAAAEGFRLYATNPFDFVLYRGHGDHTWDAKDSDFINASILRWPGTRDDITNVDSG
jgi:glycosyltransferase involved in cell wall biosynthesis